MAGEEAFWRRYAPLVRRIRREYPGFWEELREVAELHRERTYTHRGARVRDWPETREMGVQAGPPLSSRRNAAIQADRSTAPEPRRPTLRVPASPRNDPHQGVPEDNLVDEGPGNWDDLQPVIPDRDPWEEGGGGNREEEDVVEERDRPVARGDMRGCWNCGSRTHRYSACPRPRRSFCYGCGREGVTLRECENCAEGWRRLGPYHPERGHDQRRD